MERVNFTPQHSLGEPITSQRTCIRPGCPKPLSGRQRLYCSKSHLVMVRNEARRAAKAARRRSRRSWQAQDPFGLLDYLPIKERQALFLEAAQRVFLGVAGAPPTPGNPQDSTSIMGSGPRGEPAQFIASSPDILPLGSRLRGTLPVGPY